MSIPRLLFSTAKCAVARLRLRVWRRALGEMSLCVTYGRLCGGGVIWNDGEAECAGVVDGFICSVRALKRAPLPVAGH